MAGLPLPVPVPLPLMVSGLAVGMDAASVSLLERVAAVRSAGGPTGSGDDSGATLESELRREWVPESGSATTPAVLILVASVSARGSPGRS